MDDTLAMKTGLYERARAAEHEAAALQRRADRLHARAERLLAEGAPDFAIRSAAIAASQALGMARDANAEAKAAFAAMHRAMESAGAADTTTVRDWLASDPPEVTA